MSFEDARQTCHSAGGELSSVPNEEANNFLSDMALEYANIFKYTEPSISPLVPAEPSDFDPYFWIGLYAVGDAPCRYEWLDNSTLTYE
ncbi:hypothetical protein AAVH_43598, partial [Aphelenchoides avenae]